MTAKPPAKLSAFLNCGWMTYEPSRSMNPDKPFSDTNPRPSEKGSAFSNRGEIANLPDVSTNPYLQLAVEGCTCPPGGTIFGAEQGNRCISMHGPSTTTRAKPSWNESPSRRVGGIMKFPEWSMYPNFPATSIFAKPPSNGQT